MDYIAHNQRYWDRQVERGNRWTQPVSSEVIADARAGRWQVVLSPCRPVPREWFPQSLADQRILCLGCGGGQQGPILAAAGAQVTVVDISPRQLQQDTMVAARERLPLWTEVCDMRDLARFADGSFDMLLHPGSCVFIDDVRPMWRECGRVLRSGGLLLTSFTNPVEYIFDLKLFREGKLQVRHRIPYSDLRDLPPAELKELILDPGEDIAFGHSLEDLIGGVLASGFVITAFYEDANGGALDAYINTSMVFRAVRT